MKASEIRNAYLQFFKSKGHTIVASSPVVPEDDPTLLFTNAGMNQFKNCYLGIEKRSYTRATTSQKCIRAGGKHNDLDNVGYTARHHTFFEMLGNFSFGDYFKQDAIPWAWEFLTKVLELPPERLWVTVYIDDDEAYDIWNKQIGIPAERIIRIGDNKGGKYLSDNFWMMGDTGPCGPCSEIFFDRGPSVQGGPPGSPDEDGDRWLEIWNLVFTQFNRDASGKMNRLPHPNIDTGMGLERIASVLQDVPTNYDIDLFQNLMKAAKSAVEAAGAVNVVPGTPSLKVIADHIRACAFAIADGVTPGNEGRAYVLRRICRRAIRHGYKLGARKPFFYTLVKPLAEEMGDVYPELNKPSIAQVIKAEEERFFLTLANGMEILEDAISKTTNGVLNGDVVFKLHDTFGFPADLTADVCRERGIRVDTDAFDRAMDEQRAKARAAGKFKIAAGLIYNGEGNEFRGYSELVTEGAKVIALYKDGVPAEVAEAGDEAVLVFDKTPFYAEMGGQVGDSGTAENASTFVKILDTFHIKSNVYAHVSHVAEGSVRVGDVFKLQVDAERRAAIARNHSVTHLMDKALKSVCGEHVSQKGSLVTPEFTRFDFTHDRPVTEEQIAEIEDLVNREILENTPSKTEIMSIEDAKKTGAIMLFGEKYGKEVRVVTVGTSKELCGGTHVARTGDIGCFKIVSESGISAGVRRIEAVTGLNALHMLQRKTRLVNDVLSRFRGVPEDEIPAKVDSCFDQIRRLEKELETVKEKLSTQAGAELASRARDVKGVQVLAVALEGADARSLRETADKVRDKLKSAVVVLAAKNGGKLQICAGMTPDIVKRGLKAGELVRFVAEQVGGKGGGKPDFAMAGGSDPAALPAALESVYGWVEKAL
ncbi:alanine--tRNA ligase [Mesosutterella sp. AGMB02718]|uniref:Alanine--tRNA ligase n=1 Tax=Mesosutterella faecium TaxID=2925194 RepID=A0ABT7IL81_9BURK|nr:alanine--tRNA ligase [Mesosutterella sp. AGMB02718]MDL2059120.1 alanine--tRNA ligase [Mesosutterella sp. AGMB02718]